MDKSHIAGWDSDDPTPAQLKEFFAQVAAGRITKGRLQEFLRGKDAVVSAILVDWQNFYGKLFARVLDLSHIRIPHIKKGYDRLIVVAQGLIPQLGFKTCQGYFPCSCWTGDLDAAFGCRNDRETDQTYAVWVKTQFRPDMADEDPIISSLDQFKERGIAAITLLERLLFELKFWNETDRCEPDQHLEAGSITLCAGSRYSDGSMPTVTWLADKLVIDRICPEDLQRSLFWVRTVVA